MTIADTDTIETVCKQLKSQLPKVKSGSLRIWGQWFGRPYDNFHTVTDCHTMGDAIKITFNEAEELTIWQPQGINITQTEFQIDEASRVRWEWFYYGRPPTPRNRYYVEYSIENNVLKRDSNADFFSPDAYLESAGPAAELL